MRTEWLDRNEYPFDGEYFETPAGEMHYLDEGDEDAPPVVMLHGNPTWSFMYRDFVKELRDDYRCIVPDYIGFGLSDKPDDWSYLPREHSENVEALIEELGLEEVTVVMHDYGGPIGTRYAVENPGNVAAVAAMNTFAWRVDDRLRARLFSATVGGPVGRALVDEANLFASGVMRLGFGERRWLPAGADELPRRLHRQYTTPLAKPSDRKGTWVFPRELTRSSDWFEGIWERRDALADTPGFVAWGTKDPAFGIEDARRWTGALGETRYLRYEASHYLPEQRGEEIAPRLRTFLDANA